MLLGFPGSKKLHGWHLGTLNCSKNDFDMLVNFHRVKVFLTDARPELFIVAILVS